MFLSLNTTFYLIFIWLMGICYGFVLISSATNNDVNLYHSGKSILYKLHSITILNEYGNNTKNVGYYIDGDVLIEILWENNGEKLIKIDLKTPKLYIRSRSTSSPDGYSPHYSKLDDYLPKPFYLVWKNGYIDQFYTNKNQPISLINLQRGIASLFQFQLIEGESYKNDSTGYCLNTYKWLDSRHLQKRKSKCKSSSNHPNYDTNNLLDPIIESQRIITYNLDENSFYFRAIALKEIHKYTLNMKDDLGNYLESDLILNFEKIDKIKKIEEKSIKNYLNNLNDYQINNLLIENEDISQDEYKNFASALNNLRESIRNLGTITPLKSFFKLILIAKKTKKAELFKILESKKNQKILPQIYDILGYTQTLDSHDTVMKKLPFTEENLDLVERYLWALSLSPQSNPDIIDSLLRKFKNSDNVPKKLKETLILTIASMTNHLSQKDIFPKLVKNVEETITNGLNNKDEEERAMYLRALKNLKSPTTIPKILEIIKNGSKKDGVLAMKALKNFPKKYFDKSIQKMCRKVLFEIDRIYDSSARTLAVDILLESPNDEILIDLLEFLKTNQTNFEIKQYIFQHLQRLMDDNQQYRDKILDLIRSDSTINNYSILAPRGLSTALRRHFLKSPNVNGSLLTIQEMFSGIVKRGIVNIMMNRDNGPEEMFSLGIFSGGLSTFISSDNKDDDTVATAGMELTILGNQLRPFVFFNGQGELMGHVWAGTASEKTTAYQALILLEDHNQFIRIGNGFMAEIDVKAGLSFDLAGKIEISLWNRNAQSLIEKSAGIVIIGSLRIDSSFIRSQAEFSASVEPKLSLKSDLDFSSQINLCMRVTQPDIIFRHNIFKIEHIPGSKHNIRIAKYKKLFLPGVTYSLNKKNDNMCSVMF